MSRICALLLLAVLLVANTCEASHRFEHPENNSPRRNTAGVGDEDDSFNQPYVHNDGRPCNQRCYVVHFNATITNAAATNTQWCSSPGVCPVSIFIRTSPCRKCANDGYESLEETVGNGESENTTYSLQSPCMFANYTVLLGPYALRESQVYGGDCSDIPIGMFYLYAYNKKYTVMAARSCSYCKGTVSTWTFDQWNRSPNWPNEERWKKNFQPSIVNNNDDQVVSEFKAFGPASCNSEPWLHYEFLSAPTEVACSSLNERFKDALPDL